VKLFYTPDAHTREAKGQKAIIAGLEKGWSENDDICSGGFDEFQMVESVAVGWGRDTCTVTPADGQPATTTRATWIGVFERQPDGNWLCSRETFEEVE
jgi:ketosteroid isomerase-like protein